MRIRPCLLSSLTALFAMSTPNLASAAVCDLTSNGASCGPSPFTSFAIFSEVSPQPTGTGYVDPFLRLQDKGNEEGYNTSARPLQLDQKDPLNFTRDLLLAQVPIKTINSVQYREFFLDINESKKDDNRLLSLDELRIYLSPTGALDSYSPATKNLNGLAAIYDLDSGSDNWIKLDYGLNPGSGSGNIVAYIPNSLFTGPSTQYVYLFSRFGDQPTHGSDAGFEEWWVGPTAAPRAVSAIPEPTTLLLLGTGLTWAVRRRRTHAR